MSSDAVFEAAHVSPEDGSYNEGQSGASGASDSLSVSVSVSAQQQQLRSPAPGAVVGPAARVGVLMGRQLRGEQPLTAAEMLELQRQHTLRTAAEFGYLHPAATPGGNASVLVGAGPPGGSRNSSSSQQQAPSPGAVAVGASASAGGSATKFQFEPAASTSSSGAGARAAGHQRDEVELVIMPTLGSGSRKLRLTSYEDRVRSVSLGSAAEAGTSALATRAPLAEPPTSGSAKIPQNMSQYRTVSAPSGPTVVRAGDALAAAAGGGCSSPAPAADTDTNNPRFLKQRFLQGYTMDVPQQFTFEVSVEAPVVPEGAGAPAGSRPETLTDLAPAGRCEDEEQGQTTVENHVDLDTELDAGAFWHPSATSPRYDSQTRPTNRDRADQQLASTKVEVGSSSTSDISGSMMQLGGGPAAPVSGPAASASSTREENQEDFQTLAGSGVNVNVNQDVVAPATSLSTDTAGASSSTLGSRSQSTRAGAPAETTSLSSADKQRSKGSSASSSSATGGPQNQNHSKRGSSKTGGFFGGLFSSFASKFSSSTTASAATTTTNTKTATAEIKVVRTTGDGANKKQLWASREQEEAVLVDTTAGAAARSSRAVQPLPESGSPPLRVEDRPPELRTSGEGAASVEPPIEETKGDLVITTSEVSAEGGSADKNNFDFPDSGDEPIFSPASETSGTSSQQKVHQNETAKLPAGGSPVEDLSVSASLEMPAIPSPNFSTLSQSSVMSPLTYGGLEQKMQAGSMYARAQHQDQPPPTILDLQKLSFAPPQTAGFALQASLISTTSPPCTATTPSPHTTANSFAPSIFAPAPRTAQIPQTRFDLVMQEQGGLGSVAAGPPPAQGAAPDGAPAGASSPGGQSFAGSTAKVKANIFSRPAATTGGRAAPKQLSPPPAPKSSASSSPSPSPLRRGPGDENSLPTTSTITNGGPSRPSQQGRSSPNSSKEKQEGSRTSAASSSGTPVKKEENYKAPQTIIARLVLAEEFEPQLVLDENLGAKNTGVVRLHCPESSMSMVLLDGGRVLGGGDEKPDELPEADVAERETPLWSAPLELPLRFLNLGMYDLDYSPSGTGASSNRGGASPVLAATRNANPTGKIGNKNIPRKRQVSEQALVRCPLGTYEHLPKLKIQSRGSSGRVGFVDRDVNVGAEAGGGAEMGRGIFDYHVYFEADAIAEQEPDGETVRLFLDCRCWLEGEIEVWKTDVAGASHERNGLANFTAGDHLQEEEEVVE